MNQCQKMHDGWRDLGLVKIPSCPGGQTRPPESQILVVKTGLQINTIHSLQFPAASCKDQRFTMQNQYPSYSVVNIKDLQRDLLKDSKCVIDVCQFSQSSKSPSTAAACGLHLGIGGMQIRRSCGCNNAFRAALPQQEQTNVRWQYMTIHDMHLSSWQSVISLYCRLDLTGCLLASGRALVIFSCGWKVWQVVTRPSLPPHEHMSFLIAHV